MEGSLCIVLKEDLIVGHILTPPHDIAGCGRPRHRRLQRLPRQASPKPRRGLSKHRRIVSYSLPPPPLGISGRTQGEGGGYVRVGEGE